MYESAHFISSRTMSGFHDFPMPDSFPDYPGNRLILDYTRSFARTYGLYEGIRFDTSVDEVVPDGDGWSVRLSTGERRGYGAVVCATGVTWRPRIPVHPGNFDGEVRHAVTYRGIDEFRSKRVLIVGLGNSGADIACDAAASASETYVSVRRGYHIIPKHILGTPTDVFAEKGPRLPLKVERPLLTGMLRLLQGDLSALGPAAPRPQAARVRTRCSTLDWFTIFSTVTSRSSPTCRDWLVHGSSSPTVRAARSIWCCTRPGTTGRFHMRRMTVSTGRTVVPGCI
ncbi:NAD(P)-binding domain-containing protein [Prescottella defluvii]|nr:NAD(P)-binding domain-containing protein [Prescottella defluvii]